MGGDLDVGAHHSDVVDVLDEGRREQRERRGGDNAYRLDQEV